MSQQFRFNTAPARIGSRNNKRATAPPAWQLQFEMSSARPANANSAQARLLEAIEHARLQALSANHDLGASLRMPSAATICDRRHSGGGRRVAVAPATARRFSHPPATPRQRPSTARRASAARASAAARASIMTTRECMQCTIPNSHAGHTRRPSAGPLVASTDGITDGGATTALTSNSPLGVQPIDYGTSSVMEAIRILTFC